MPTLLIRLVGPMQSWGTTSMFSRRDTNSEPSKSGVVGILAAAMGIDRSDWKHLKPLTKLKMGIRHDRSGTVQYDFQTAGCAPEDTIARANGSQSKDGVISKRYYLSDACFLVGLESKNSKLLSEIHKALYNPYWGLSLGRKSYLPSQPIYLKTGLKNLPLKKALKSYSFLGRGNMPSELLFTFEAKDGERRNDLPIAAFSERKFGTRYVKSKIIKMESEYASV